MPLATKELQREYNRIWIAARRQAWIDEHGPCRLCGSDDRLEVDHIDPSTKSVPVASVWSMSLGNPKRIAELEKCQVLCYTCHKEKTRIQMSIAPDHGVTAYRNGCRCVICRHAQRDKMRRYRAAA